MPECHGGGTGCGRDNYWERSLYSCHSYVKMKLMRDVKKLEMADGIIASYETEKIDAKKNHTQMPNTFIYRQLLKALL